MLNSLTLRRCLQDTLKIRRADAAGCRLIAELADIYADRVVRLGQDMENEQLRLTHQSAFCDKGRIYEHQVVDMGSGKFLVQDLEYWTEGTAGENFRYRLYQNQRLTADVVGR